MSTFKSFSELSSNDENRFRAAKLVIKLIEERRLPEDVNKTEMELYEPVLQLYEDFNLCVEIEERALALFKMFEPSLSKLLSEDGLPIDYYYPHFLAWLIYSVLNKSDRLFDILDEDILAAYHKCVINIQEEFRLQIEQLRAEERKQLRKASQYQAHLSSRENMLLHCYKGLPAVMRGEKDYDHYIAFCTPRKRLSFANDSSTKAKHLIKSIETVIPYLNNVQKQQAMNEIDTLRNKFCT